MNYEKAAYPDSYSDVDGYDGWMRVLPAVVPRGASAALRAALRPALCGAMCAVRSVCGAECRYAGAGSLRPGTNLLGGFVHWFRPCNRDRMQGNETAVCNIHREVTSPASIPPPPGQTGSSRVGFAILNAADPDEPFFYVL